MNSAFRAWIPTKSEKIKRRVDGSLVKWRMEIFSPKGNLFFFLLYDKLKKHHALNISERAHLR